MWTLQLREDRTDVDMDRLAQAFSISRIELEGCLGLRIISYRYELGASDYGTPQMAVRSTETDGRIALYRVGNVVSRSDEGQTRASRRPRGNMSGSADPLPNEASRETHPHAIPSRSASRLIGFWLEQRGLA